MLRKRRINQSVGRVSEKKEAVALLFKETVVLLFG